MPTDHPHARPVLEHTVYLLRVWYEPGDLAPVWRASLHLPDGTPRKYFAAPGPLLAYLGTVLPMDTALPAEPGPP